MFRPVIWITVASCITVCVDPSPAQNKQPSSAPIIHTEMVTLQRGGEKLACYVARPADGKPAPGLILIHEWWGLNDWVKKQADRYAAMGYVAVAPDLYRGELAKDAEHAHELMRGLADERAVGDMKAAFDWLSSAPSPLKAQGDQSGSSKGRAEGDAAARGLAHGKPIGVMGWCMGGGFALKLAIAEPRVACTVICYGRPVLDVAELKKIKGPLLGIWGGTDRGIEVPPFEKALKEAGVKAAHHVYPGAGHAFLNETNKRGYNKEQAKKGWKEIDGFLGLILEEKAPEQTTPKP